MFARTVGPLGRAMRGGATRSSTSKRGSAGITSVSPPVTPMKQQQQQQCDMQPASSGGGPESHAGLATPTSAASSSITNSPAQAPASASAAGSLASQTLPVLADPLIAPNESPPLREFEPPRASTPPPPRVSLQHQQQSWTPQSAGRAQRHPSGGAQPGDRRPSWTTVLASKVAKSIFTPQKWAPLPSFSGGNRDGGGGGSGLSVGSENPPFPPPGDAYATFRIDAAQQALCEALSLMSNRNFASAAELLLPTLHDAERFCDALLHQRLAANVALCFGSMGDYARAAEHYRAAVRVAAQVEGGQQALHLRLLLAQSLREQGKLAAAHEQLDACVKAMESSCAAPMQVTAGSATFAELDPSTIFIEFSRVLVQQRNDAQAEMMLHRAVSASGYLPGMTALDVAELCAPSRAPSLPTDPVADRQLQARRTRFRTACVALARVQRRQRKLEEAQKSYQAAYSAWEETCEATSRSSAGSSSSSSSSSVAIAFDAEYLTFELATFLHHEMGNAPAALMFYEVATENAARHTESLRLQSGVANSEPHPPSPADLATAVEMQAKIMFNAGLCIEKAALSADATSEAAGILFEAIRMLVGVDKGHLTGRMRLHCARMLATADYVDRALEQYAEVLRLVAGGGAAEPAVAVPQIAANNKRAVLHRGEVEAHLAHCLHYRVGDYVGAEQHYESALQVASALSPVMACFVCDSYAALLVKLQRHPEAVKVLLKRIDFGDMSGDASVSAKIQLAHCYEAQQMYDAAEETLRALLLLPEASLTVPQQLDVVCRLAYLLHYCRNDFVEASKMYEIALRIECFNPHFLVQAAWCLSQNPAEPLDRIEALYNSAIDALEAQKAAASAAATAAVAPGQGEHNNNSGGGGGSGSTSGGGAFDEGGGSVIGGPVFDELYVNGEIACFYHDRKKDVATAEAFYKRALSSSPQSENFAQVAANYALLLNYEKKDRDGADEWFARALESNPYNLTVNRLYADYLVHINRYDKCIAQLKKMIDAFPGDTSLFHKMAQMEERAATTWNVDDAILLYCKALGAPVDLTAWSEEIVLDAVRGASDEIVAVDAVACIHYKARLHSFAHRCYEALLTKFPRSMHAHLNFARLCFDHLGDAPRARRHWLTALDLQPQHPQAIDSVAEYLASIHSPGAAVAAEKLYLHSIACNPRDPVPHYHYACFLTTMCPRAEAAERHFRRAIELGHPDPQVLCCYGAFLETQLDAGGPAWEMREEVQNTVEKLYRRALAQAPRVASHHVYLGTFLWKQKEMADAWACFQDAMELEPSAASTMRTVATFLHDWHALSSSEGGAGGSAGGGARNGGAASQRRSGGANAGHGDGSGALLGRGQLDSVATMANELFIQAIKADPNDLVGLQNYARFLASVMNQPQQAQAIWDAVELRETEAAASRAKAHASAVSRQPGAASTTTAASSGECSSSGDSPELLLEEPANVLRLKAESLPRPEPSSAR